jgi:hypothetical protein
MADMSAATRAGGFLLPMPHSASSSVTALVDYEKSVTGRPVGQQTTLLQGFRAF